jgi:hypothetical protein
MIRKLIKNNSSLLKLIIEILVVGIFVWTFTQVRDIPGTYITRAEANQIKVEIKTDIDRAIEPMRKQIQQIYNHLLGEK